jgi:two-component system cell cycle response regulator DivK
MVKKILVVEDNPINMKLMIAALRPQGYQILQAVNGEEAVEVATRDLPDLIIMDMRLPKMSGWEVTKKLRERPEFSNKPIIAVTAYAMKGDEDRALEAGCDAYLAKPINVRELRRVITELLP